MAIMGSSGSGKTTFLNYLTRNVIDLKEPSFKILHDQGSPSNFILCSPRPLVTLAIVFSYKKKYKVF